MRTFKRLLIVATTMVALAAAVPSVAAHSTAFHPDKTCSEDASEPLGFVL